MLHRQMNNIIQDSWETFIFIITEYTSTEYTSTEYTSTEYTSTEYTSTEYTSSPAELFFQLSLLSIVQCTINNNYW